MNDKRLNLFGSAALTDEEESLREALMTWCQDRLNEGARPIPLQAALMIVSDCMASCDAYGFVRSNKSGGWKP